MNFTLLRYFRAVAYSEQMTQTAAELRIAQPSLSRAIKKVEEEVGQELFIRQNNRIILNRSGRILLHTVDEILSKWDEGLAEMKGNNRDHAHQIVMNVSSAGSTVPHLIQQFRLIHPQVSFIIHGQHKQLWEDTICDLFLFSSIEEMRSSPAILLQEQPLYFSVGKQHPLADKTAISLKDCKNVSFLFSNENNDMYDIQLYYCRLAGFSPQIELKIEKQNILIELLALGQGATLLPRLPMEENLVQIPIVDFNCRRFMHIMLNPRRPRTLVATQFQQFCVDYFQQKAI